MRSRTLIFFQAGTAKHMHRSYILDLQRQKFAWSQEIDIFKNEKNRFNFHDMFQYSNVIFSCKWKSICYKITL